MLTRSRAREQIHGISKRKIGKSGAIFHVERYEPEDVSLEAAQSDDKRTIRLQPSRQEQLIPAINQKLERLKGFAGLCRTRPAFKKNERLGRVDELSGSLQSLALVSFHVHLYKIDFSEIQRIEGYLVDRLAPFMVVVDPVQAGIGMMHFHLCRAIFVGSRQFVAADNLFTMKLVDVILQNGKCSRHRLEGVDSAVEFWPGRQVNAEISPVRSDIKKDAGVRHQIVQ